MPFKSDAQRRFMYSQHPRIARRWREESGPQTNLPERVKRKKKKSSLLTAFEEGGRKLGKQ